MAVRRLALMVAREPFDVVIVVIFLSFPYEQQPQHGASMQRPVGFV